MVTVRLLCPILREHLGSPQNPVSMAGSLDYCTGCASGARAAPFSWGALEIARKVVLMAWWH